MTCVCESLASAGEALGAETDNWAKAGSGYTANDAIMATDRVQFWCSGLRRFFDMNRQAPLAGLFQATMFLPILGPDGFWHYRQASSGGKNRHHARIRLMIAVLLEPPDETAAKVQAGPQKGTGLRQAIKPSWMKTGLVSVVGGDDDIITSAGYPRHRTHEGETAAQPRSRVFGRRYRKAIACPALQKNLKAYVHTCGLAFAPSPDLAQQIQSLA